MGDILTMDINFNPAADEEAYLYCTKIHQLPNLTDLGGLVSSAASEEDTTLIVKGLQAVFMGIYHI